MAVEKSGQNLCITHYYMCSLCLSLTVLAVCSHVYVHPNFYKVVLEQTTVSFTPFMVLTLPYEVDRMLQSTQLMVTVWLVGRTILELTVLLMVTVRLTGCCNPRTDCLIDGDCAVNRMLQS